MGPTPPTAEQLQLISDYEPALFFYRGSESPGAERFFPSDAKSYLKHAALYRANAPYTKAEWGAPVIATGQIAASDDGTGVFLGKKDSSATPQYPFLEAGPGQELILDVSGLKPGNGFADLDALARLYAGELKDSQYWYHAEAFDKARLQDLFDRLGHGNFSDLFNPRPGAAPALIDPTLICYYLFYPGHDESLPGCQDANGNKVPTAVDFGSFAGEWSCIALLLDRAGPGNPWAPKWVGLSNRNLGKTLVGDQEVRATMRVLPWSAMDLYGSTHPRFNVSLGSHGLYVAGETLPPLGFDDLGASYCGGAAPFVPPGDEYSTHPFAPYLVWTKILAGNAAGGLFGGPIGGLLGAAAGAAWGIAELPHATWRTHLSLGQPNFPAPDNVSNTGLVIHPKGLIPPGVAPTNAVEWKSDAVDRQKQPLWGADVSEAPGFTGRWGAHVEQDLQTRRSGMAFPQFWRLFFDSLVRNDPPARHIELTAGTTWTVPADWNSANNTIELIGGGGGGSAGLFPGGKSGAGGGGGAYAKSSNIVFMPDDRISFTIGAAGQGGATPGAAGEAGGDTNFNNGAIIAKGGAGGVSGATPTGGAGGSADQSVGTVKFAGGNGGGSDPGPNGAAGGGGGGGAGGPNGVGGKGGTAVFDGATPGGGAGGGGNGGGSGGLGVLSATTGGNGGNNAALTGSGAGSPDQTSAGKGGALGGGGGGGFSSKNPGNPTTRGGDGGDGADLSNVGGGGGGGGGGSGSDAFDGSSGGEGGDYGGGGGGGGRKGVTAANNGLGAKGAPGVIRITYTPDF